MNPARFVKISPSQILSMRSDKSIFIATIIILLLIILNSCAPSQPLTYNGIENFKISDIKTDPHLDLDLKLHNPNPIGFKLKKIDLQFTLDNQQIGSLNLNKPVKLRGNQDFTLPLTFGTSITQLAAVAKPGIADVFAGKHIPFQFEGDITLQKFIFFRKTFHFNFSDDVSLNKIKIQ